MDMSGANNGDGENRRGSTEGKHSSAITVADKEGIIQTVTLNGLAACAARGGV